MNWKSICALFVYILSHLLASAGPRVTSIAFSPATGAPNTIMINFDEDIDGATVLPDSVALEASGGDGSFGDGNEVFVASVTTSLATPTSLEVDLSGASIPVDAKIIQVPDKTLSGDDLLQAFAFQGLHLYR